ncbi:hypothetical protein FH972_004799 [Carpinus fangiana]|uniref:Uncharacterized protein n=1 Tax=Carpinus fangiana TaxID=176857 RepID=A0A5N6QM98_9ROSI|nr:hypothetical protein FH972_004799 [Carpinus fangiana]
MTLEMDGFQLRFVVERLRGGVGGTEERRRQLWGWKVVSCLEGRQSGERVWVVAAKVTVKGGAEGRERESILMDDSSAFVFFVQVNIFKEIKILSL